MSSLLNSAAVSCLKGQDAAAILEAYIATEPAMVFSHTPGNMQKQPKGTGAGDRLIEPK